MAGCIHKEWKEHDIVRNTVRQFVLKDLSKKTPENESFWKLKNVSIFGNDGIELIFAGKIEIEESGHQYASEFPVWCSGEDASGQKIKHTMIVEVFLDRPDHISSYRVIEGNPLFLSEQIRNLFWTMLAMTIAWSFLIFILRANEYNVWVLRAYGLGAFLLAAFAAWYVSWWCFGTNNIAMPIGIVYGAFISYGAGYEPHM